MALVFGIFLWQKGKLNYSLLHLMYMEQGYNLAEMKHFPMKTYTHSLFISP